MDMVKKVLKFSGIIAAVLALVAVILLLATDGIKYDYSTIGGSGSSAASGVEAIFGKTADHYQTYATWAGILGFFLAVIALVILVAGIVLPLVKVNVLDKYAGILNLAAVVLLVVAGICVFCIVPAWKAANGDSSFSGSLGSGAYYITGGWGTAGILLILAGLVAIAPAAIDFVESKK